MEEVCSTDRRRSQSGLTLIELVVVAALAIIVAAVAIPMYANGLRNWRLAGDARAIASQLALTRMRAANEFTQAELSLDTSGRTFQIKIYNKSSSTFVAEGGSFTLSSGNTFGYGALSTPAGTQTTIGVSNPVIFNSRGIPITSSGVPTGTYAIYLTDSKGGYFAITVSPASDVAVWKYSSGWVQL
jgi:Tfp pilus assembly protein FimT